MRLDLARTCRLLGEVLRDSDPVEHRASLERALALHEDMAAGNERARVAALLEGRATPSSDNDVRAAT